jgi:aerobic carbon-monoxide dehydrogenase medium subunit
VKPPPFEYVEPPELDSVVELLAADEDARPLAGGQSLVPMLSFRLVYPTTLVGLRRLTELKRIERRDGELVIGAMVSQSQALRSFEVAAAAPLAHDALRLIGHPQIRSRGTVGGTLAHADPAAELPAVLVALGGAVTVHGPGGTRSIAADDLFAGFFTTSLEPGEVLVEARFPAAPPRTGAACFELARRPGDFAAIGVASQLSLAEDGSIADARVALFGVADVPVRARDVEQALIGRPPGSEAWAAAGELATVGWSKQATDSEDARYRARVAPVLVRRTVSAAAERAA